MLSKIKVIGALALLPFAAEAADELYSEFSEFETKSSVRAGVGYTENVLLGEKVTVDSPFTYLGLEGVANKKFWADQMSWNSLAYGDLRSYEELNNVPDHSIVLLQSELEGYVGMIAKGRIGARYLNLTQVFDATFDEVDRVDFVVEAEEPEFYVGYGTIVGDYSYELELGFGQMSFADLDSDYQSLNLEFDLERELTDSLLWKTKISGWERSYDDRNARSLSGISLSDTLLKTTQLGAETGIIYFATFGEIDHEFEVSASFHERSDRVTGYYDRERYKAELEWSFFAAGVEVGIAGGYTKYNYANQLGEDGAMKFSDTWYWEVELERDLTEFWSVFLSVNSDEDRSNEEFSTYETSTALLGIRWR